MKYIDPQEQFIIKFTKINSHWVDFKAVEVWLKEDDKIYYDDVYNEDFEKAATFFTGFIKWDGCMEIHDLNYHFCGYGNILQRVVKSVYEVGSELMGDNFNKELANFSV